MNNKITTLIGIGSFIIGAAASAGIELLNYLSSNNITSVSELENRLNSSADKYSAALDRQKMLSEQISIVDKIVSDGARFLELSDKVFLSADEKSEYKKVSYV